MANLDNDGFFEALARDRYMHCFKCGAKIIAKYITKKVILTHGNSFNITIKELMDRGITDKEADELNGLGWYADDEGCLAFDMDRKEKVVNE